MQSSWCHSFYGVHKQQFASSDAGDAGIDKELDLTKDNLKSFVERWDGGASQTVEIPRLLTAEPSSSGSSSGRPKKSSSTSSLAKAKRKKEEAAATASNHNDVSESSDFITPTGNNNDSQEQQREATPNHSGWEQQKDEEKQEELPGAAAVETGKQKIVNDSVASSHAEQPPAPTTSNNPITKDLLAQLEQIEIHSPSKKQPPQERVERTSVNGTNYLQVDGNLATSSPASNSPISSRGELNSGSYCYCPCSSFPILRW